jgi:mannose-1-phosphate guanylyltransferase
MKAFLLAAGHGTRLRPITDTIPKCLVPICGVPMLQIWLEVCRRAGIDEVMLNLHAHAGIVRQWLNQNGSPGVHVRLSEEVTLLGSAGTLLVNRDWVHPDPRFWILYADVLTNARLRAMLALHDVRRPAATLGLYQVPDPSRCGIVSFDEQNVIRGFVEKPAAPAGNWAFAGVMIGTPRLLDRIPPSFPSDLGYDVLPHLLGHLLAYPISEFLLDIGTLKNYRDAQGSWPGLAA